MTATLEKNTTALDKERTIGNNQRNVTCAPRHTKNIGGLAADCTKKSALPEALTVPETKPAEENRYGRGRRIRSFRREHGAFIAKECGVRFVREELLYDPKSAEKVLPTRYPITESDITLHRANLRQDLTTDKPERTTTLEGIYHWLAEYAKLTPEQQQEAEDMAHGASPKVNDTADVQNGEVSDAKR